MLRVISSCKPTWVIGENVEGLINIQDGMVLRSVQDDLEREGFQVQCLVIPASGIGAWHQRNRVWIIGCNVSNTKSIGNRRKDRNMESENEKNRAEGREITISKFINDSKNVSNTNSGELHGCISTSRICRTKHHRMDSDKKRNGNEVRSETERCSSQNTERENVSDSNEQRLQEHELSQKSEEQKLNSGKLNAGEKPTQSWWQTQSELCGVPNGVSYELHSDRTDRIKALGNSIVPQIAEQIFRSIIDAE